jgi:hypothetical protein
MSHSNGMTAIVPTAALPEATLVGALNPPTGDLLCPLYVDSGRPLCAIGSLCRAAPTPPLT